MSEYSTRWPDRILALLYWPILVLAWTDAVLAAAATVGILPARLLVWAIVPTGGLAAVVFLMAITDAETRRAVNRVNATVRVNQDGTRRRIPLFDPKWGLFGSIYPDRPLLVVNRVLFVGFGPLLLMMRVLPGEPLFLVFAAFFMTGAAMFPLFKRTAQAEPS